MTRFVRARLVLAAALLLQALPVSAQVADADGDGLPDAWERQFGLDPLSAAPPNGGSHDPDGDGLSNQGEYAAGSHPRGLRTRRLAEGASNSFFTWRLALGNPGSGAAHVLVTVLQEDGSSLRLPVIVPASSRHTLMASDFSGLGQVFSMVVESDVDLGVDRLMTWAGGIGSHAESSVGSPSTRWFLAEGATGGGFNLFYLLQNPGATAATVTVRFLRPAPDAPLTRTYVVAGRSRFTIWVDEVDAALAATDVSADITSTLPIVVERAMYLDAPGLPFVAGHAAAGVPAAALEWFLAEGATGTFFDEFVLLANPQTTTTQVQVEYLLPDGQVLPKQYDVAPQSRRTIWVDHEHPWLENTPVSIRLRSLNAVPFVAERTMWWADGGWFESHNSPGATSTGIRWLASEGEIGGPEARSTYVLLANTSPFEGRATVTLLFEGGGTDTRTFDLAPTSRFNVDVATLFPAAANRRFATVVESLGPDPAELVVEWSIYGSTGGRLWETGANALAMNLSPPLRTLTDLPVFRGEGPVTLETFRAHPNASVPTFSVTSSVPSVAAVTIDATTGRLRIVPGSSLGATTVTVTARVAGQPDLTDSFVLTVIPGRAIRFGTPVALDSWLFPAVADFNNDGRVELAGTLANASGQLVQQNLRTIGLGPIVDLFATFANRDNRAADVNGDGRLDLVTWAYTSVDNDRDIGRLFLGQANGTYVEDPAFAALDIRGWGHTIVAGDYDNDRDVDLFLVGYTHNDPREQFYLLLNDGTGRFTEVADAAGVATRGWPEYHKAEGAQALDFDNDGDLDLFAASHFYFNEGVVGGIPRFVDRRAELGLPARFDEGLKFLDFDNDGLLDLLLQHPSEGPQLWRYIGTRFELVPLPVAIYDRSYGANVYDMNGDGFEDLILAPGGTTRTRILLNTGLGSFIDNPRTTLDGLGGDTMAFGDFNGDGRIDIGRRAGPGLGYALNTTSHAGFSRVTLDIVDANGARNQFGRVAFIRPRQAPGVTYTRVVDGGSGFIAQNQYALLVGTPYTGQFDVTVRFAAGERQFVVSAGQRVRLYSDGRMVTY